MCEGTGLVVYLGCWLRRCVAFWKSQVYTRTSLDESQIYTHNCCEGYALSGWSIIFHQVFEKVVWAGGDR